MKTFKIILAILATIGLGIAIYIGYTKTTEIDVVGLPENQFTRRVNQEIIEISNMPVNQFCRDAYDIVEYHIDDYASINRLGADQNDSLGNRQNQQFLCKILYSTYVDKFIAQADYVFSGNAWPKNDLNFIDTEAKYLRSIGLNCDYLEDSSSVAKELLRLTSTINSYASEIAYINKCESFSFNNTDLETFFPIQKGQSIINESKSHLSTLGILRNCEAVKNGLSNIPQIVFSAHVNNLANKLSEYKEMYMYYATLAAYKTNLYDLLNNQISQLDNSMYSGLNVSSQKSRLLKNLKKDYDAATTYFRNKP